MIEISTSKIKKIIVIIKNWSEKGNREDVFGLNPHSNGEIFSRSKNFFFEINIDKIIKMDAIVKIIIIINNIFIIIYIIC